MSKHKPRGMELPPRYKNVTTVESFVSFTFWQRLKIAVGYNINCTVRFFTANRTGAWNTMMGVDLTYHRTAKDYVANEPQATTLPEMPA